MNSLPPNISKLIGQMIMVGIKGHDRDAVKDFFERNKIDITTKMLKGCGHNIPIEASSLGLTFLKKIFNINS